MDVWRTALVHADDADIRVRGYAIAALMQNASFAETVFLLHRGQRPRPEERRLLDAILTAVADHGAGAPSCAAARLVASGNRQSLSAAIAAGVLAIGDAHGGAGQQCMELISEGLELAVQEGRALADVASQLVERAKMTGTRLPGFGHRVHTIDPRVSVLFTMATEGGIAGDGISLVRLIEAEAHTRIKPLPLNIDGALAAVLHDLGFSPLAGHLLFVVGRVAGLTAEIAEEYARERPMRIRIPVTYDGEPPRALETT